MSQNSDFITSQGSLSSSFFEIFNHLFGLTRPKLSFSNFSLHFCLLFVSMFDFAFLLRDSNVDPPSSNFRYKLNAHDMKDVKNVENRQGNKEHTTNAWSQVDSQFSVCVLTMRKFSLSVLSLLRVLLWDPFTIHRQSQRLLREVFLAREEMKERENDSTHALIEQDF